MNPFTFFLALVAFVCLLHQIGSMKLNKDSQAKTHTRK